jgi:hypothetical protein
MAQKSPDHAEIEAAVAAAQTLADNSAAVRRRWRRRNAPTRQPALEGARQRCADAAPQLRSWIGMSAWGGISTDDDLAMKRVMEALRYERRQIDKMLA